MWDDSFRWNRLVRRVMGAIVLAALGAGLIFVGRTTVARQLTHAVRERIGQLGMTEEPRVTVDAPSSLGVRVGHLVYLDRPDGESEVIGRVVGTVPVSGATRRLELRLTTEGAAQFPHGGLLQGTSQAVGMEAVIRLLLSPDQPGDEAERARTSICPAIERHVLPGMEERLWPEMNELLDNLSPEDRQLLEGTVAEVRRELAPLEEELVQRMARTSWNVIGVRGVTAGLWRLTTGGMENTAKDVRDWWRTRLGSAVERNREDPEFLSAETQRSLRQELQQEWTRFWSEHRSEVTAHAVRILSERSVALSQAARERWGPHLYERVIQPAWAKGEPEVIRAIENYAQDFSRRRLLTPQGAPRLLLAYALRSELGISSAPLLVLTPVESGPANRFHYQPLIPALVRATE